MCDQTGKANAMTETNQAKQVHSEAMANETSSDKRDYQLPLYQLMQLRAAEANVPFKEHKVVAGAPLAIDLRVDWDGVSPGYGSIEVMLADWENLPHPEPTGQNDVVSLENELRGNALRVRFERGPDHPRKAFKVRALPITWLMDERDLEASRESSFVALRDTHYRVDGNPQTSAWTMSTREGPCQRAELELVVGTDYEIWISLENPTDPDAEWLEQDPIVRTGGGGGGGGIL